MRIEDTGMSVALAARSRSLERRLQKPERALWRAAIADVILEVVNEPLR